MNSQQQHEHLLELDQPDRGREDSMANQRFAIFAKLARSDAKMDTSVRFLAKCCLRYTY